MNERRQVGANGPQPISVEAILAYAKLADRTSERNREYLMRFIPALDRIFLNNFYEKQAKEYEEMKKKQEQAARRSAGRTR